MVDPTNNPTGQQAKQEAKEAAASVKADMKNATQQAAESLASGAEHYADQARNSAADEVKDVASALRKAADELRSGSPQERSFSQIADGLADASEAIRDKDLGEMMGSVNDFARRNPLVFLGSAALVGFAATRFAKASSAPRDAGRDGSSAAQGHVPATAPVHAPAVSSSPTGERA